MLHCKKTKGHANKCYFQRPLGLRNNVLIREVSLRRRNWNNVLIREVSLRRRNWNNVLIREVSLRRRNWNNFGAMRHVDFHFQPLVQRRQIKSMWDATSPSLLWVVALSFCLTTLPSRMTPCGELLPRHLYIIIETKLLSSFTGVTTHCGF